MLRPRRLGEPPTVKLPPLTRVVQSFHPEERIPGEFGVVRSVRLANNLEPSSGTELVRGIQSRQEFLRDPSGEAYLPRVLPPERQGQVADLVKQQTGYDVNFGTTPSGQRTIVSWAEPTKPKYVAPPQDELGIGYPAVRMQFKGGDDGLKLNLRDADIAEARGLPSDYGFGRAPEGKFSEVPAWGEFAKSDLKQDVRGYAPKEYETTSRVLGDINQGSLSLGSGEIGDVMMRGGFPISASSEMANEVYQPSATPKRWVDAPTSELDSYQGTQALMRTGTPDALNRVGYSVATNQSAPLQDVLTGVKGVSDLRLLPSASEPAYVTRHGQTNPAFLSSTPSRLQAYGRPGVPGYEVLPQELARTANRRGEISQNPTLNQVALNSLIDSSLSSEPRLPQSYEQSAYRSIDRAMNREVLPQGLLYPVKTRDVTNSILEAESGISPQVRSTVRQYNADGPEPAYVIPPKLEQATGGYDVTAVGSNYDYPDKAYASRIQVQMPSTVLKDKGTSSFDLSLGSSIDAGQAGLGYTANNRVDRGEMGREGLDEYVQAHKVAGVKNEFGEDAYIYTQPTVDARDQLEKLEGSFRRSNVPYNLEAGRAAARSRTPNSVGPGSAMDSSFSPARLEAGAAATVRRMLGNGEGGRIGQRLIDEGYARPGATTAELQDAYDRRMQSQTGLNIRSTVRPHDVREQYRERVFAGQDAINSAYANDPNPATERFNVTLAGRDGAEPATWEREGKIEDMLQASRKAQLAGRTQLESWLPTDSSGQTIVGVGPESVESLYVRPSKTNPIIETAGRPQILRLSDPVMGRKEYADVYPLREDVADQLRQEVQAGTRKVMPAGTTNPSISMNRELVFQDRERGVNEGLGMQQVGALRAGGYDLDIGAGAPSVAEQVGIAARPRYVSDPTEYNASAGRRLRGERAIAQTPEPKARGKMSSEELLAARDRMLRAKFGDNYQQYLA